MIHPTAVVHPGARVHENADVGPFAVIDEQVTIGAGCRVGPHVHITGCTLIGVNNTFHAGCVIGDAPQDVKYKGDPTVLRIGDGNVFREHVTVHRSNSLEEATQIGSNNFLMAHSHVGHNTTVGNNVILANGALIGGHVEVGDRAFLSGNCLVHQFVRIGAFALMQGGSAVSKDLPPYTIATGKNRICGLNIVGLRRAGFTADERLELKRLYHAIFRGDRNIREAAALAAGTPAGLRAQVLIEFVLSSSRGVCADVGHDSDVEE